MFWLIAFFLPLVLLSCSKNPVDTQDQPKATGKIAVVCTYSPTVTAKILASTVSAEITFWEKENPSNLISTAPLSRDVFGEFVGSADNVPVGEYCVAVKGYAAIDPNNGELKMMTYYGSSSSVNVTVGATATVEISLVRPGAVTPTIHGINMVSIPAGCFAMGQVGIATPVHTVMLSAFEISATEITQGQYYAVMGTYPSNFHSIPRIPDDDALPVEGVPWFEATAFCAALGSDFRLPTEAEWEYACRAGSTTNYNLGDVVRHIYNAGWYDGNSAGQTRPVGQWTPNAWGLYDMHGNVWECCNDWYGAYEAKSVINPTGVT